jgi:RNA polymerase sigma factor (sigma-70 family)
MQELDDAAIAKFVEQELTRRKWTLATQPELIGPGESFAERVIRRVNGWQVERRRSRDETLVHDTFIHEYCHLLHQAMSRNGSRVQSIALEEMIAYAWPVALKRCADKEMTERAILRAINSAWVHIADCHEPGGFLAWFVRILQREISQEFRQRDRLAAEISEIDLSVPQQEDDIEISPLEFHALFNRTRSTDETVFAKIERQLSRDSLLDGLRRCLQHAQREFIVRARFFGELNPSEIAAHLSMTAKRVYEETHRALGHMKGNCPDVVKELLLMLAP